MMGTLIQINTKSKTPGECGLPKYPIDEVFVSKHSVGTDYNNFREERKNGTDDRAVLIYTTDKFNELKAEGWPVKAGDLGENFTIEEIPYESISIGDKFQIGEVIIEITEVCNPCTNLANLSYVGENKIKQFIEIMKGRRGWYAKVLHEGNVSKGMSVKKL